jgi:GxxExxY protein
MHERLNPLTERIIGAALEVHRELGPGLLESAYEACLAFELSARGLSIEDSRGARSVFSSISMRAFLLGTA